MHTTCKLVLRSVVWYSTSHIIILSYHRIKLLTALSELYTEVFFGGGGLKRLYGHLRFEDKTGIGIYRNSVNRLTTNDPYMDHTALLTSKRCILYIYSTNIGTEYFKHAVYSPFFSLQNAVCFIILTCLVHVLFTFYIQDVLKLKKRIIPAPKG